MDTDTHCHVKSVQTRCYYRIHINCHYRLKIKQNMGEREKKMTINIWE